MTVRISSLLLAVLMVLSLSVTAFAADSSIIYRGRDSWNYAPGSAYTSTDLFDGFKDVMPGDVRHENILFTNKSRTGSYIKVYIKGVLHDASGNPLTYSESYEAADGKDQAGISGQRDETVASMMEFLGQLNLVIKNGSKEIFRGTADQALKSTYLGTLKKNESLDLDVELNVPMEMGNEFANRVGEVDWQITVEEYNKSGELIQTGQMNWPIPVLCALGVLLIAAGWILMTKKRKNDRA